jgi:hypothetical protein
MKTRISIKKFASRAKFFFVPFLLVLFYLLFPEFGRAQFLYVTNRGSISITQYTGTGGVASIPSSTNGLLVTSIGPDAFYDLPLVTGVIIPDTVTNLGVAAFSNCTGLTNVIMGKNIASIGDSALAGCSVLTTITIPASVTSLGAGVFAGCNALTAITVDPQNFSYSSVDGVLLNGNYTTLIEFPAGKGGNYAVPNGLDTIGIEAFLNCTNLTGVTIPASVYSLGDGAFFGCTSLTNVALSSSLETIPPNAFEDCVDLTGVAIPISVTDIDTNAFAYCGGLTSITIGNEVTSIQDGAFEYCSNLAGIYFQGNAPATNATGFTGDNLATAYYLPGATGWTAAFDGIPTAPWVLPAPRILNSGPGFGVLSNSFGFIISWGTNATVVIEATTDLAAPGWSPVGTNTLTGGSSYFSDSQWTNYARRFYRFRSP